MPQWSKNHHKRCLRHSADACLSSELSGRLWSTDARCPSAAKPGYSQADRSVLTGNQTLRGWWTVGDTFCGGTPVAGGSIRKIVKRFCLCALTAIWLTATGAQTFAVQPGDQESRIGFDGASGFGGSYTLRKQVIAQLPMERLTTAAQQQILSIAESPTIYRRLPTQAIDCDRDMFLFLTRNSEVLVGIWDLMGITKVTTKRTGPYQIESADGGGTQCRIDLVYGDPNVHIFVAEGSYDGKLVANPIRGRGVFILHSTYAQGAHGGTTVTGSLDCFIQLDSLGADLVARTLSGLIGRSADHNFIETARFIAQISQAAENNPTALIDVAQRLPQVNQPSKFRFVEVITNVARRSERNPRAAIRAVEHQIQQASR